MEVEDVKSRKVAFQALLRDVGQQLGKSDTETIELFEEVPVDERGKGGIRLLEHLQRKGRFSLWKIQPLREVLRECNRCDIADNLVKSHQLQYEDRDSPLTAHRLCTQPVSTGSPLLSFHSPQHQRSLSTTAIELTPPTQPQQQYLDSLRVSQSPPGHPSPSLPHQEVGPNDPSLHHELRGFPASTSPQSSTPKHHLAGAGMYQTPVQEDMPLTGVSSLPQFSSHLMHSGNSTSNPNIYPGHKHPHHGAYVDPRYQLANTAIQAVLQIVSESSKKEFPSITSIHSYDSCKDEALQEDYTPRHSKSFAVDTGQYRHSTFPRRSHAPMSDPDRPPSYFVDEVTPKVTRRGLEPAATDDKPGDSLLSEPRSSTQPTLKSSDPVDISNAARQTRDGQQRPASGNRASLASRLLRPLSGHRKKLSSGSFVWRVKREQLMKSLSRPTDAKFRTISCSHKFDLDVGQGKNNPKLALVLYPYGLFDDEGKAATLQAKILTPDKCPPLPTSLCVQLKLSLTVFSNQKTVKLKESCVHQTINTHTFYVQELLSCEKMREKTLGEHVELSVSVETQQM